MDGRGRRPKDEDEYGCHGDCDGVDTIACVVGVVLGVVMKEKEEERALVIVWDSSR